jgi:hypothetical protein
VDRAISEGSSITTARKPSEGSSALSALADTPFATSFSWWSQALFFFSLAMAKIKRIGESARVEKPG